MDQEHKLFNCSANTRSEIGEHQAVDGNDLFLLAGCCLRYSGNFKKTVNASETFQSKSRS
jgi:hypothetical protein